MKQNIPMRYSPYPAEKYHLEGIHEDEVSVILSSSMTAPAWNLFWLSSPLLDGVPGSGKTWHRHYKPTNGLLSAVFKDLLKDEVLSRKSVMHPMTFAEWFERQSPGDFQMNRVGWKETVLMRAAEASDRLIMSSPPVRVERNVVYVNFRSTA